MESKFKFEESIKLLAPEKQVHNMLIYDLRCFSQLYSALLCYSLLQSIFSIFLCSALFAVLCNAELS